MTTTLDVLHRSRRTVRSALLDALGRLDRDIRPVAAYHFGFTGLHGGPPSDEGKAVRPGLAMASAAAAGAPDGAGLPGAVAVELVHSFSLVHDDLMDGDRTRRHRPTVWSVWGPATAILVGDALLALAQEILTEAGTPQAARAGTLLAATTRQLVRGQMLDLEFERRDDVTPAECLDMCAAKTGALLSTSAAIGAVLSDAPGPVVTALAEYGAQLGLAYQLVDDLLGIWGDPATTGKPVFSDLRSRKKSLPVCHAVNSGTPAGNALADWLADARDTGVDGLRRGAALVAAAGGRDWAAAEARRRVAAAEQALRTAAIPAAPRAELIDIARFVVDREH
ncbi:polyprenyl synthetase family protein [Allokutzneria oryzae]|uniref:Polyprenyl synthetase family protein n=1 Tax=Allokutzneria oryzae TaxID=1378989 RepID=A0ABV5ZYH9_9PSEU